MTLFPLAGSTASHHFLATRLFGVAARPCYTERVC